MPFLKITTSVSIEPENRSCLLKTLSSVISKKLGKAEQYVMVGIESASLLMSGEESPAAMVELRSLGGLDPEMNKELSSAICDALHDHAGIPPERVFINFSQWKRSDWGCNGTTFA